MHQPVWHCFHLKDAWQLDSRQRGLDGSSSRGQHQHIIRVALLSTRHHVLGHCHLALHVTQTHVSGHTHTGAGTGTATRVGADKERDLSLALAGIVGPQAAVGANHTHTHPHPSSQRSVHVHTCLSMLTTSVLSCTSTLNHFLNLAGVATNRLDSSCARTT